MVVYCIVPRRRVVLKRGKIIANENDKRAKWTWIEVYEDIPIIFYGSHFSAISINFISLFSTVLYVCRFAYQIFSWSGQLKSLNASFHSDIKGSSLHFLIETPHRMYLITIIKYIREWLYFPWRKFLVFEFQKKVEWGNFSGFE